MALRRKTRASQILRHRSETIELPPSGNFRIAMISDTHGNAHKSSALRVREQKPDLVLHGGDVGPLEVLQPFEEIAPLHVVRGNIDPRGPDLPDSIDFSLTRADSTVLRLLLTHIAVSGVTLRADARRLATLHKASMVVCGHSHVPFIGRDRGVSVINPGSIGPRRFNLPIVFGVLDINECGLSARHISCETGEVWLP